jgi:hypothetical protein
MNEGVPFKIATALIWRYGSWDSNKKDNLKPWMEENVNYRRSKDPPASGPMPQIFLLYPHN